MIGKIGILATMLFGVIASIVKTPLAYALLGLSWLFLAIITIKQIRDVRRHNGKRN